MQIITTTISFFLLIGLIVSPSFIIYKLNKLNVKNNFIFYLIFGIIITSILMLIVAWWSHFSTKILLSHYGYNFDSMNLIERFENVSAENLDKVKNLEISMMGIGWPLKAIMSYLVYCPYILIVYIVTFYFTKIKKGNIQKRLNDLKS
ncbi:hypothetical protein [Flavobacterium nackdongense]|jgi:hypothetical protein|uniref:Uncharacterized protein n=1 Tax=Flavobacterium nackdongense TaxID=2547394 RepID=A0A4P6Y5E4_9FLAO|nr:hypothetical protein [Flavobacterium nackdongense]QBN17356.1 hypothetical protein E1750_00605 [Flavobacterium nackdongense]